jgi:hypothetical protein
MPVPIYLNGYAALLAKAFATLISLTLLKKGEFAAAIIRIRIIIQTKKFLLRPLS